MQMGYKLRRVPQQRRLVRHLMRIILELLQSTQRPMRDTEIISTLAARLRRSDPEFQRQVALNLEDAVSYGILKRQLNVYSLRSKQLSLIVENLAPSSGRSQR
ncbi:uncharacterized protein LOC6585577 [Drosophila mojavensis]|uniref:DUF4777 domain-containing protein n=2 Tax=mojavensis species complex TaxID=198037 RepID=B4L6Q1_DROMO|nr:uncharacterized protein LOC6585577 [Drosophila mojavensis]XP_017870184.1 PREDICTED: uncharacterized protein LOC108618619 [Drosophila arizonae]XP_043867578.1 uncharacterized protein LOC6585577 [Drosophila mojavensis]EDW06047.1 uncharacterized protein Dmoj_GI16135 [Drosophila mojavensis]